MKLYINEFVCFFLEDIFFGDNVLNELDDKFFFGDFIHSDNSGVIEVDSTADSHQDFHIFKVGADSRL
jgi:hypothetical protein